MMFGLYANPFTLRRKGILGMNERNHAYIARYNPRSKYPLVDNKLNTKLLAQQAAITVPHLLGVIELQHNISQVFQLVENTPAFVIKPAKGSGGKGILVIHSHDNKTFTKASGSVLTAEDVERHISNILSGLYSLGGAADVALIEDLITCDPRLAEYSFEGVPDIRVIVCRGYPVMAMIRLATRASDGKANLHQGAVGVGLDLGTGKALRAVQFGKIITHHPDTNHDLSSLQIPNWNLLLELAARCYDVSGLGYIGTDMVLDKKHGPMLLELNARPGLAIQMANGIGLVHRLKKIDRIKVGMFPPSAADRVRMSQSWFANE